MNFMSMSTVTLRRSTIRSIKASKISKSTMNIPSERRLDNPMGGTQQKISRLSMLKRQFQRNSYELRRYSYSLPATKKSRQQLYAFLQVYLSIHLNNTFVIAVTGIADNFGLSAKKFFLHA